MELQRSQINRFNRNRSGKGRCNHGSELWSTCTMHGESHWWSIGAFG